jgi:hypothetical protein
MRARTGAVARDLPNSLTPRFRRAGKVKHKRQAACA